MIDRDYHGVVCMACESIVLHSATLEDMVGWDLLGISFIVIILLSIYGTEIGKVGVVWFGSQTFLFLFSPFSHPLSLFSLIFASLLSRV